MFEVARLVVTVIVFAFVALTIDHRVARADNVADARADYEAGAAAYDKKDYPTAATRFSRADERAPNPRALQLAMAAAVYLDESSAPLAMNLVERAESRAVDGSLAELARKLRAKFGNAAGRIKFVCPSAAHARCRWIVDSDDVIDPSLVRWVSIGSHKVVMRFDDDCGLIEREVRVAAGSLSDVAPTSDDVAASCSGAGAGAGAEARPTSTPSHALKPTVEAPTPRSSSRGISPAFFWTGVGVTAAGIGAASVLTVLHSNAHDDFVRNPSAETSAAGDSAQTNMIVGWAVAGGLLLTTLTILLFTDFGGGAK